MKLAWLILLPALAASPAIGADSVFDEQPIWDRNGGPSIYDTYGSANNRQPKPIIPMDNAQGYDGSGLIRRSQDYGPGSVGNALGGTSKACNLSAAAPVCN